MANYERVRKGKDVVVTKNGKHVINFLGELYSDPCKEAWNFMKPLKSSDT